MINKSQRVFGIKFIRLDQKHVGPARQGALFLRCFWSGLILFISKDTNKVFSVCPISGDSLKLYNGKAFTTKDNDNDEHDTLNCAARYSGAGWFQACIHANLNGLYLKGNHTKIGIGVNWFYWKGLHYSLKSTSMKMRRI